MSESRAKVFTLSVKTVRNCWNHAKILPAAVVAPGPDDTALNELATLLLHLSDSGLRVEDVVNDSSEQWPAAPLESDDEDAECRAAMQAAEEDEENAGDSEPVVPMTLRDARAAAQALRQDMCTGESEHGGFAHAAATIVKELNEARISLSSRTFTPEQLQL